GPQDPATMSARQLDNVLRSGEITTAEEASQALRAFIAKDAWISPRVVAAAIAGVKHWCTDLSDFISVRDVATAQGELLLDLAQLLKLGLKRDRHAQATVLPGKTLALVFEKPSLRTRVTFEAGMTQLGGHAIYLGPADIQLGTREPVADAARNLERWV